MVRKGVRASIWAVEPRCRLVSAMPVALSTTAFMIGPTSGPVTLVFVALSAAATSRALGRRLRRVELTAAL